MATWAVILAGGIGQRFWPVSRASRPKQLLDLFGEGPMLAVTRARADALAPADRTLVVTSTALADEVAKVLPEVPRAHVLAEPVGRNTAPAIAWAAKVALASDPDATLMVLPADHHIADVPGFHAAAAKALAIARDGTLVTLGIAPTHPETGYGYIRRGAPLHEAGAFAVAAFVEKPDLGTAAGYLASGDYAWNAGMFFMRADAFQAELARWAPDVHAAIAQADDVAAAYAGVRSISVDYAVMEKSDRIAVVPASFGWSDVGSWRSLWDHRAVGAETFARGEVVEIDGHGNVLYADGGGVVVAIGVSDLVVVHTPDATLVCPRDQAQRAKDAAPALAARGREDVLR